MLPGICGHTVLVLKPHSLQPGEGGGVATRGGTADGEGVLQYVGTLAENSGHAGGSATRCRWPLYARSPAILHDSPKPGKSAWHAYSKMSAALDVASTALRPAISASTSSVSRACIAVWLHGRMHAHASRYSSQGWSKSGCRAQTSRAITFGEEKEGEGEASSSQGQRMAHLSLGAGSDFAKNLVGKDFSRTVLSAPDAPWRERSEA